MQTESGSSAATIDQTVRGVVAELVSSSRKPQRDLLAASGLSKDQLCRTLRGTRAIEMSEALAILTAADYPARGALALALFRPDLAVQWSQSGMAAFLEALIDALPDALTAELGDEFDRINPRWGAQSARFMAQRLARHVEDLIEREQKLGECPPVRSLQS